jgi:hypothetical protein
LYSDEALSEPHIVFRVDEHLKKLVEEVAKLRGERVSDFVRRVIKIELAKLSYLTPAEKKALGVLPEISPARRIDRQKR